MRYEGNDVRHGVRVKLLLENMFMRMKLNMVKILNAQ
jgi:hypothetical protein